MVFPSLTMDLTSVFATMLLNLGIANGWDNGNWLRESIQMFGEYLVLVTLRGIKGLSATPHDNFLYPRSSSATYESESFQQSIVRLILVSGRGATACLQKICPIDTSAKESPLLSKVSLS
jgi:hypothetical protein